MGTIGIVDIALLVIGVFLVSKTSYLANELKRVNENLDRVHEQFEGLREYLYEIDPQFDDERRAAQTFEESRDGFAGMDDLQLQVRKEREGRRTLNSPLVTRNS